MIFEKLKQWAQRLKQDVVAVYYAARDSRTPKLAKLLAMLVAAYALSPIDLVPDFVPIIGYLDDLLIVPAGLWLVVRLLPSPVLSDARIKALETLAKPKSYTAAMVVLGIWIFCIALFVVWWYKK